MSACEQDTGQAYGPMTDRADLPAFEERGREDRHQFRLIVSPEDAEQLDDLRTYTRHLMAAWKPTWEAAWTWMAVNHWNTDNPHTLIVLRGKDDTGKDLIISQAYITRGMRERAAELSTEWLGPRTEPISSIRWCVRSIRSGGPAWIARCNARQRMG